MEKNIELQDQRGEIETEIFWKANGSTSLWENKVTLQELLLLTFPLYLHCPGVCVKLI